MKPLHPIHKLYGTDQTQEDPQALYHFLSGWIGGNGRGTLYICSYASARRMLKLKEQNIDQQMENKGRLPNDGKKIKF